MLREFGLRSVLEEGVVQNRVIDVNFAHFRLDALPHFLLEAFARVVGLLPELVDARIFDKVWQLERPLVNTPLVLEVAPLLAPVVRHLHRVPDLFQLEQKQRIRGRNVPIFDEVGPLGTHLQLEQAHPFTSFLLFLAHFLGFFILIFVLGQLLFILAPITALVNLLDIFQESPLFTFNSFLELRKNILKLGGFKVVYQSIDKLNFNIFFLNFCRTTFIGYRRIFTLRFELRLFFPLIFAISLSSSVSALLFEFNMLLNFTQILVRLLI